MAGVGWGETYARRLIVGQLGQGALTPATVNISPPILGEWGEIGRAVSGLGWADKLLLSYPGPITSLTCVNNDKYTRGSGCQQCLT